MPAMNWYQKHVDRWRNSPRVMQMTLAERGAYHELLDYQFTHPEGYIPNIPNVMWQFARCTPQEWDTVKGNVLAMFDVVEDGKYLSNETIREQWVRAKSKCDTLAENGRKGGFRKAIAKQLPEQKPSNCSGKNLADIDLDLDKNLKTSPDAGASVPVILSVQTPEAYEQERKRENEIVDATFEHYCIATERNRLTYRLTPIRRKVALRRLDDCLKLTKGDYDKAAALLCVAIDNLARSDWHMGRDPATKGKKYCDWIDNLFKSYEQLEKWWNT